MTLDQRGQHAATLLEQHVQRTIDPTTALRQLYDADDVRAPARRRRAPMLVAFASVAVVIAVVVAVLVSSTPNDPTVKSTDPAYAYLPTTLPTDMQPAAQLVAGAAAPSQLATLRGVRFVTTETPRASVSVITSRGATLEQLGLSHPPPPYERRFQVHGHTAQYLSPSVRYNLPTGARSLVWQDGGATIEVRGVGLSLREVLRVARGVGRADKSHFTQTTEGLPIVDVAREMYGRGLEPEKGERDLTTYEAPDGQGAVVLTTPDVEGIPWLCIDFTVRRADGARGGGGSCVDPDKGFEFPTRVYDFPWASFLVGSFGHKVESVEVRADDGATYTATFHDTHEGKRPLVAVVGLGTRRPGSPTGPPNARVVVTDTSGRVLRDDRITI